MKKLILSISIVLIGIITANAQMRWGAEAGLNTISGFDTDKTRIGFNIGVTAEYSFSPHWFMNTSLKLSSKSCGFDSWWDDYTSPSDDYLSPRYNDKGSYTPYYLVLPLRVGYGMTLNSNARLSFAIGPSIGVGLFGKGRITTFDYSAATTPVKTEYTIDNVFNTSDKGSLSNSRFEFGGNVRIELELRRHYTIGLDCDIKHLTGDNKALKNIGVLSLNLGYKF